MVIVAPMTTGGQPYPWRVECRFQEQQDRVALDQLRTVDRERLARYLGVLTEETMGTVLDTLTELFARSRTAWSDTDAGRLRFVHSPLGFPHCGVLNSKLLQVGFVPGGIVVVLPHLRPVALHDLRIQLHRRLVAGADERLVLHVLGLHIPEVRFCLSTRAGLVNRSSSVIAVTFAPAVAPLWAIGVAMAIALDQLCPGSPGMLDG